jgi:hypothetical protein
MPLPTHFCWTRFGTEAGETIQEILARKDLERRRNDGLFLWGIGNAVAPSLRALLELEPEPEVLFSPIRSPPREVDVNPSAVIAWRTGRDLEGSPCRLPDWSTVTSRSCPQGRRRYALVCYSAGQLELRSSPPLIALGHLENLLTGKPVGASQVTAVVRRHRRESVETPKYAVAIRTRLVHPFLIELHDPITVPRPSAKPPLRRLMTPSLTTSREV